MTEASPLSSFMILICSSISFYSNYKAKVEEQSLDFVDYRLVLLFCPLLILGTKIGAILNRMLPSIFLTLIMMALLIYSIKNTYSKYKFK